MAFRRLSVPAVAYSLGITYILLRFSFSLSCNFVFEAAFVLSWTWQPGVGAKAALRSHSIPSPTGLKD